jgi:hypothetical protein
MVTIKNPFLKETKIVVQNKEWNFPFKFYISKNKRPFRLSGVEKTDSGYVMSIFWLDNETFESFDYDIIEPYLI